MVEAGSRGGADTVGTEMVEKIPASPTSIKVELGTGTRGRPAPETDVGR
jgi:hypothetical protein